MERSMTQKLIAEFVGTFALIFIGVGAILTTSGNVVAAAFGHGLAIAVMVSSVGHVSGGHFNPAVTIAALSTQKIAGRDAMGYLAAQLLGGLAAAGLIRGVAPASAVVTGPGTFNLGTPGLNPELSAGSGVVIEAVLTFFLVWVIFATAIDPEGAFGKIAGLAIGLTITMDIFAGGAWTGAAMNPARWFGPALVSGVWSNWWVWIVGPVAGGIVAAVLYDSGILLTRGTAGEALSPEGAPHGWGAHGEDDDSTPDAHED
jgi:aquaporin Z